MKAALKAGGPAPRRQKPHVGEHEHEAAPGLPAPLPAGEQLLWRGAPDWRVLARHGFQLRGFMLYFGALIAWRLLSALHDGASVGSALATTLWTVPLAALALGFIVLLARLVAHNTVYTLTDRRIVMRVGVVLTVSFNIPLRRIQAASLHAAADGSGSIALQLQPEDRIGWLHLWPHVRPWHFSRTQPMLRALPQVRPVAGLLADALAASAAQAAEARQPASADAALADAPWPDLPVRPRQPAPRGATQPALAKAA